VRRRIAGGRSAANAAATQPANTQAVINRRTVSRELLSGRRNAVWVVICRSFSRTGMGWRSVDHPEVLFKRCMPPMILAQKIVKLRKTKLDRHSLTFGVPYGFYFGTKNENRDFIEQNRLFHSLGEDLGPLCMANSLMRRLRAWHVARETPGPTVQPNALVNEAWLRLAGQEEAQCSCGRHFFCAATEAMRRILVQNVRDARKNSMDSCFGWPPTPAAISPANPLVVGGMPTSTRSTMGAGQESNRSLKS
jgi:hypothetical protein